MVYIIYKKESEVQPIATSSIFVNFTIDAPKAARDFVCTLEASEIDANIVSATKGMHRITGRKEIRNLHERIANAYKNA